MEEKTCKIGNFSPVFYKWHALTILGEMTGPLKTKECGSKRRQGSKRRKIMKTMATIWKSSKQWWRGVATGQLQEVTCHRSNQVRSSQLRSLFHEPWTLGYGRPKCWQQRVAQKCGKGSSSSRTSYNHHLLKDTRHHDAQLQKNQTPSQKQSNESQFHVAVRKVSSSPVLDIKPAG